LLIRLCPVPLFKLLFPVWSKRWSQRRRTFRGKCRLRRCQTQCSASSPILPGRMVRWAELLDDRRPDFRFQFNCLGESTFFFHAAATVPTHDTHTHQRVYPLPTMLKRHLSECASGHKCSCNGNSSSIKRRLPTCIPFICFVKKNAFQCCEKLQGSLHQVLLRPKINHD
jgi:hypothetical protein